MFSISIFENILLTFKMLPIHPYSTFQHLPMCTKNYVFVSVRSTHINNETRLSYQLLFIT